MSSNKLIQKIEERKEGLIITYKLAVDFLVILIIATFLFLIAEGLIFGIASENIGFVKMVFLLALDILLIYVLGNILEIDMQKNNKKIILAMLGLFMLLLISSSLIKINIFLAVFILVAIFFTGYKIFSLFFEDEN